jgi:hypothetical protein
MQRGYSATSTLEIKSQAQESGLLSGRPAELAEQFSALLWRDWMISLLLGVAERPSSREIAGRAHESRVSRAQLITRFTCWTLKE